MMKIGIISTAYTNRYGLAGGVKKLKAHGYECTDYQNFMNTETELFRVSDSEFEKRLLEEKEAFDSERIEIIQAHGPWRTPQDATEEDRAERFEKMAKSIWGAKILGCKHFVIHPLMPFGADKDPEPERLWEINYDFMSRLCKIGQQNGIVVNLENMPFSRLSLSCPAEILTFVKNINSEWFKVCLDTGHAAVFGESPGDAVRLIGKEYLGTLHVHDNNGRSDLHWIPYTGVIDWADFAHSLSEIGFEGAVSLETDITQKIPADARELMEISLYRIAAKIAGRI